MSHILAIDPGNTESAYVIIDSDRRPIRFDKLRNQDLIRTLVNGSNNNDESWDIARVAIEMVASYGMAVGADVFETCVWIGRFYATSEGTLGEPQLIKRHPIKVHHCHSAKATDTNIRQALVDRFAKGERNHGKGTKAEPGWFYGFHSDVWAAYALAVFVADQMEDRP